MQAIVARRYGPPDEVLELDDIDMPVVGDDDVLVRTRAASVNPADWHLIRGEPRIARLQFGLRRPKVAVLGCDVAGEIEAVGRNVTTLRPGDDVFASSFMHGFGAFAEYVRVPAHLVAAKPAGLPFEQAAAVPLAALTALQGLRDHGQVETGRRVLIVGASGGVGTFAVQIARSLGAEVTGVCSTRNVELVSSLGAERVIDYTREDVTAGGARYDVVLQVAGTTSPGEWRRVLTPEGRLVQISGDSPGRWIGAMGRMISGRALSPFVSQSVSIVNVASDREDLEHLAKLVETGSVTPVIDRAHPLREVPEALTYLEAGHARGKVVITV
jgi:NADPH:quinone reductase-like Zn-dependent oxidoreductase